jgi:hypothetical protein
MIALATPLDTESMIFRNCTPQIFGSEAKGSCLISLLSFRPYGKICMLVGEKLNLLEVFYCR